MICWTSSSAAATLHDLWMTAAAMVTVVHCTLVEKTNTVFYLHIYYKNRIQRTTATVLQLSGVCPSLLTQLIVIIWSNWFFSEFNRSLCWKWHVVFFGSRFNSTVYEFVTCWISKPDFCTWSGFPLTRKVRKLERSWKSLGIFLEVRENIGQLIAYCMWRGKIPPYCCCILTVWNWL